MRLRKPHFFLFLIILFGGFLVFPETGLSAEVNLEEIEDYPVIPEKEVELILGSLAQASTDKLIEFIPAFSFSDLQKQAALVVVRKTVRAELFEYMFVQFPEDIAKGIVKIILKLGGSMVTKGLPAALDEIEKMTTEAANKMAIEWLLQKEIRISTGNLNLSYPSLKGNRQEVNFFYVIVYHPLDSGQGELSIEVYSSKEIEPPPPTFESYWEGGAEKVPPFVFRVKGRARKEYGAYYWINEQGERFDERGNRVVPEINIEFPEYVPDLGIEPLSWIEKQKKGIEDEIKEKEAALKKLLEVLAKATGSIKDFVGTVADSVKNAIGDLWTRMKSVFSNFMFFGGALINPSELVQKQEEIERLKAEIEDLKKEIESSRTELQETEEDTKAEDLQELKEPEEPQDSDLSEEEIKKELAERLNEISEQIDALGRKIAELKEARAQKVSEEEEEKEEEEELVQSLPKILISEVCAGLDKSQNEFIELYNPNNSDIYLSDNNFKLKLVNSSNKSTKKKISWIRNTIPSHSYFLLVGGEIRINGQKLKPDATFNSQLTGTSGVILTDGNDVILDKIGWGKQDKLPPSQAVETKGVILENGLQTGKSLQRAKQGDNLIDTDNNSQDFILSNNPSPTNSLGERKIYQQPSSDQEQDSGGSSEEGLLLPEPASCSQQGLFPPTHFPIIINEIAWIGTSDSSSSDEWIELKNLSEDPVSLQNWQLLDKDLQIKIIFEEDIITAGNFYLLERSDDNSVPNIPADKIYTGALNDQGDSLRLFNQDCQLIDEVVVESENDLAWLKIGEGDQRKSMERSDNLSLWHPYWSSEPDSVSGLMGTPKAENSQPPSEEEPDLTPDEEVITRPDHVLISEVQIADKEFIELYNPLEEDINMCADEENCWYLSYFPADNEWNNPSRNKRFPSEKAIILAKNYYLIGLEGYPEEGGNPDSDWQVYGSSQLSNEAGGVGIFSCNPKIATSSTTTLEQAITKAKNYKIDALGWGNSLVREGEAATFSPSGKSLSRKIGITSEGYLAYKDTDNNRDDFGIQEPTPKAVNQHPYFDLDNDGIIDAYDPETVVATSTALDSGEYTFKDLIIDNGAELILRSSPDLEKEFKGVKLKAENLFVAPFCAISADGKGYFSEEGPGAGKFEIVGTGYGPSPDYYCGSGAGYGGNGGRGYDIEGGVSYGSFSQPTDLGSGGGNQGEGGAGGGAVIIEVTDTLTLNGLISSNGEDGSELWSGGGGSGGSIYITTNILEGSGVILARGGNPGEASVDGGGAGGRIAIYYEEVKDFDFNNIKAYGGDGFRAGGAGTIYLKSLTQDNGDLIIDNNYLEGISLLEGNFVFNNLKVLNLVHLYLPENLTANNIEVKNGSVLETQTTTLLNVINQFDINLNSFLISPVQVFLTINTPYLIIQQNSRLIGNFNITANNLIIDSTSFISADGKGYFSEEGPGAGKFEIVGTGYGPSPDYYCGSGAGYGGRGGNSSHGKEGGPAYGDLYYPTEFGSGGGNQGEGGAGGGAVIIQVEDTLLIDGLISANGEDGSELWSGGGGSGGSIYITTNTLEGLGIIISQGGKPGEESLDGGGAGGRIAVYYSMNKFTGVIQAHGGESGFEGGDGEGGTIFLKAADQEEGEIFYGEKN